jgi:hypothetical protein
MKKLTIALGLAVGFIETGALGQSAGLSNIQAIQSAEITQLKQEIKSLTECSSPRLDHTPRSAPNN